LDGHERSNFFCFSFPAGPSNRGGFPAALTGLPNPLAETKRLWPWWCQTWMECHHLVLLLSTIHRSSC
jgi:hypothetical protein